MNFLSRRIDLHFIDSPETAPKEDGFFESRKVIENLKLPKDRIFQHECNTLEALEITLQSIAEWRTDYAYPRQALPFIHIATHGVSDGLVLGSGEPIGWAKLIDFLKPISVKTDNNLLLAMSSCHGFYAYRLAYIEKDKPYHLLIGPTQKVLWKYLITGFTEFYNRVLVEGYSLNSTVDFVNKTISNSLANLDYTFGWEVQENYSQVGFDTAAVIATRRKRAARKLD